MSGPALVLQPQPTGGCCLLCLYGAESGKYKRPVGVTELTLSRSADGGSTFVTLYSGEPLPFWLDTNDGPSTSSQPLNPTIGYIWRAQDSGGTTQAGPAMLGCSIITVPDGLTQILIRLIQAGFDNMPRPSGVTTNRLEVSTRAPAAGWPVMPYAVLNLDLFQQADTATGQDIPDPNQENVWTLPGWARRVWTLSILSANADERDFFRDAALIMFRTLKGTLFNQVAQNIHHTFQAASGATVDDKRGQGPILYWADVQLTLEGEFVVSVLTSYGRIEEIDTFATVSANGQVVDETTVPNQYPSGG